ncbi:FabD/lysophospholipase-like protein [Auricularia subglabra TFB-10046 SS5]|nr:FabD/lysophospholipase-like protein [Auricularia subglabra TFB-10046 SS5]
MSSPIASLSSVRLPRVGTSTTVCTTSTLFSTADTASTAATSVFDFDFVAPAPPASKNILSLDAGGVRGIFELVVLEKLQVSLDELCEESDQPAVKLIDLFDEVIGVSAGGLVAILIGALRLSPAQAIDHFTTIAEAIFKPSGRIPRWLKFAPWNYAQRRSSSSQIDRAFAHLIELSGYEADVSLGHFENLPQKITVVALDTTNITAPVLFSTQTPAHSSIPLCTAARATTAAPRYYKPVSHNGAQFVDGAVGYSNPVGLVDALPHETNMLFSIGAGTRDSVSMAGDISLGGLFSGIKALAGVVTCPTVAHRAAEKLFRACGREDAYIRLEPPCDFAEVRIDCWKRVPELLLRSREFVERPEVAVMLRQTARRLLAAK